MFLIDVCRAVISSIRRGHGVYKTEIFILASSRTSWIYLMTTIGPRKHRSGGTRMWFSQTLVLTDYDNRSVFGDKNNEEDDTPPKKKKKRPIVCRTFSFTTCRPPTSSRRTILPYPGNENGVTDHDEQHYGGLSNHIRVTDFAV